MFNLISVKRKIILSFFFALLLILILNPIVVYGETNTDVYQSNVFADIANKVDNGVVKITSYVEVTPGQQMIPFANDPFFKYFFGDQMEMPDEPQIQEGYGSGFLVSKDGYIVTNEHVIHDAKKIEVTIKEMDESVKAKVVWSEFELDLAIIKVDIDEDLKPIEMGDSSRIRPGDWAIAIGNPFGFEHTVTTGVISALGRPIQIPTGDRQIRNYRNLIQTDAAINPGNSGGPLLNPEGKDVGINTAVSTQGQGIGFAIPINEVKDIVNDLKVKGEIIRPWLGISFGPINNDIKEYFNLANTQGVIISEVFEGSPAEKAGLKTYDIIKEIDEQKIEKVDDVVGIIKNKEIGDKIMLRVIRNANSEFVFAKIGKRPNKL